MGWLWAGYGMVMGWKCSEADKQLISKGVSASIKCQKKKLEEQVKSGYDIVTRREGAHNATHFKHNFQLEHYKQMDKLNNR